MDRIGEGFKIIQDMGTHALSKARSAVQTLQENWSDPKKMISDRLDKALKAVGYKARNGLLSAYWFSMNWKGDYNKEIEAINKTVGNGIKSGVNILAFVPITAFKLVGLIPNMIRRGHEEYHPDAGIAENTKAVLKGALLRGVVKPAARATEGLVKDVARFGLLVSVGALGCYHQVRGIVAKRSSYRAAGPNIQFSKEQMDAFNKVMDVNWTKEIGRRLSGKQVLPK